MSASIKGLVKDDQGNIVVGLTVKAESDAAGLSLGQATTDALGNYRIDGLPLDTLVRLSASGKGFTTRVLLVTIGTGVDGAGSYNQDFSGRTAVTLRPEIIGFTAQPSVTGVAPDGTLSFTFSAPIDKDSVTRAFAVQLDSTSTMLHPTGALLPAGGFPATTTNSLMNSGDFTIEWLTPARANFKPVRPYPSVATGAQLRMRATFNFNNQIIKDTLNQEARATREARDGEEETGPFFIAGRPQAYVTFSPIADSAALRVLNGLASFQAGVGGRIRLTFSRPLRRELLNGTVLAGGASGSAGAAPAGAGAITGAQAAANYEISVNGGAYVGVGTYAGATAVYDFADVAVTSLVITIPAAAAAFVSGDQLSLRVKTGIMDSVGNIISLSGISHVVTTSVL